MQGGRNRADGLREKSRSGPLTTRSSAAGFSLIELLVTMVIIILLATFYWNPNSGSRQSQLQTACQKNLQKVYVAMEIFANENAGRFPVAGGARNSEQALDVLVPRYTSDTSAFICPGSKDPALPAGESFLKRKISYAYYMGYGLGDAQQVLITDKQVDTQSKAVGQALFSANGKPPGNNHRKYGGNLLYCDGHIELSPAQAPVSLVLTQGVVLLNP